MDDSPVSVLPSAYSQELWEGQNFRVRLRFQMNPATVALTENRASFRAKRKCKTSHKARSRWTLVRP